MARAFASASSQYLSSTSLPVSDFPLTFSAWWYANDLSDNRTLVCISDADLNNYYVRLAILTTGVVRAQKRTPGTLTVQADSSVGGGTGAWYHAAGTFTATTVTAYFNGLGGTPTVSTLAWTSELDRYELGRVLASSAIQYHDGMLANVGVWNVALTAAEIASLAKGISPLRIRPSALRSCLRLFGTTTDESDLVASRTLTNNGTTKAAHPRTFFPRTVWIPPPTVIDEESSSSSSNSSSSSSSSSNSSSASSESSSASSESSSASSESSSGSSESSSASSASSESSSESSSTESSSSSSSQSVELATPPFLNVARTHWLPGAEASDIYVPGIEAAQIFVPGVERA